jgi:hypothetical protein
MMSIVERRHLAWLVSLPLVAVGSLLAHAASYRLAAPGDPEHARLLAESGHRYLTEWGPLLAAALLTLLALGVTIVALEGARGQARPSASIWPFALLPLLGFALQEHLERLIHLGRFPYEAVLEPTFLVGILLQLPFVLAALLVARALIAATHVLGRTLAGEDKDLPAPLPLALAPAGVELPLIALLALGHAERGPPRRLAR